MQRHSNNLQSPRRGSLFVETLVAAIILGATISILVPAMTAVRHQRQSHRFETLAMIELNNIAGFLPTAGGPATPLTLSAWFKERYTNANLDTEILPITSNEQTPGLQAVRLTIHQPAFASTPEQKVSVVVWQRIQEPTP